MRVQNAFIFLLMMMLFSCNIGTTGTWKNDHIDENVRNEIALLNKKLFKSIVAKDADAAKKLMSPLLIENSAKEINTIADEFSDNYKSADYQILDEYYSKNLSKNITNTILSDKGDNNDYKITYLALNAEMYASLLVSKNLPVNFLILVIYGKYDDGWKINILQVGNYTILDKTAPDYYQAALEFYKKGNLITAANYIIVASEIAHPSDTHFIYEQDSKMKAFFTKVMKDFNAKYKLPLTINQLNSQPQIFSVNPQVVAEGSLKGIFPMIKYQTKIKLDDSVSLKVENEAIQKSATTLFKGIDQDNSLILFQAFNQVPYGKTQVKHYGFLQKLK